MSVVLDDEVIDLIDGLAHKAPSEQAFGAYDAARRFDDGLTAWAPALRSADLDLLGDKGLIDARVRDVSRNDAYVAAGAQLHKDSIVGAAYLLNSKPAFKVLGLDEVWAEEFQQEVEEKFTLYAESPRNWIDAQRVNSFTEQIRLAVGVFCATGEVLASAEWLRDAGRPFHTALQMIELDRLSNPYGRMDDKYLRAGVEKNDFGAPTGYWIQVAHPTDFTVQDNTYRWKYVPATKPWGRTQIIHIFDQQRPEQSRGVSQMVAALKEIRITKKFRDVTLASAVLNATYAASIESELPSQMVFEQMGAGRGGNLGDAIAEYGTAYLGAVAKFAGGGKGLYLDGVKVPHFFPGTKLQMRPAGTPGGVGTDFEKSLLRYIAANLGVSYEQLSKDYSETNYSSARAGVNETEKFMAGRKKRVADGYATHGFMLWLEEAINKKQITSMPRRAPSWYEGLNAEAYSQCEWIGASKGQIDELKETQAAVLRLKYNLSTQEKEVARFGGDWRKVNAQREREMKDQKARGLVVEQDNSINAASGAPRQQEAKDEPTDGSEDNANA